MFTVRPLILYRAQSSHQRLLYNKVISALIMVTIRIFNPLSNHWVVLHSISFINSNIKKTCQFNCILSDETMSSNQQSFIIYRASIKLLFEGTCKFTKLKKNSPSALGIAILQNTSCCAILITTIFIQYILIHFNCYTKQIQFYHIASARMVGYQ